jgi:hypothetical protein
MNKKIVLKYVLLPLSYLLALAAADYFLLPAYNLQSFAFWVLASVALGCAVFILSFLFNYRRAILAGLLVGGGIFLSSFVISAASWLIWPGNSEKFYGQMPVTEEGPSAFLRDFPDVAGPGQKAARFILPRTDKQLSIALGQSKLGDYGARYRLSPDTFTSINVRRGGRTSVLRISPLDYTGFLVALTGGEQGTAGYVEVNQESEEARLVLVPEGIKYTPGAILGHDLMRHIRFAYRSAILGTPSFEIDDKGRPFWTIPVLRNEVGLFSGADRAGIIAVNAVTGEMRRYAPGEEPDWVDRTMSTEMVIAQANAYLRLKNGWFNTLFGEKRDVFQLSDSYNYVSSDGPGGARTWLVSGITSPSKDDETLVGFLMVDMKTKEARRYPMSGITEMRAMEIAQGDEQVKAQALEATWPILVNVGGEPVYFLFLKNNVQRQRFVYIDLAGGQKVAMGETLEATRSQFNQITAARNSDGNLWEEAGTVLRVKEAGNDGSIHFLLVGQSEILYTVKAELSNGARFLQPGDKVEVSYKDLTPDGASRFVVELRNLSIEKK